MSRSVSRWYLGVSRSDDESIHCHRRESSRCRMAPARKRQECTKDVCCIIPLFYPYPIYDARLGHGSICLPGDLSLESIVLWGKESGRLLSYSSSLDRLCVFVLVSVDPLLAADTLKNSFFTWEEEKINVSHQTRLCPPIRSGRDPSLMPG